MTEKDNLSLDGFKVSPVWTWTDDNEHYRPVLDFDPLPENLGDLFIKVKLTCADGSDFDGCVVGFESYHAFSMFYQGEEFTINLVSKELLNRGLQHLWKGLGREIKDFFPVKFEADLFYKSGKQVKGELVPSKRAS